MSWHKLLVVHLRSFFANEDLMERDIFQFSRLGEDTEKVDLDAGFALRMSTSLPMIQRETPRAEIEQIDEYANWSLGRYFPKQRMSNEQDSEFDEIHRRCAYLQHQLDIAHKELQEMTDSARQLQERNRELESEQEILSGSIKEYRIENEELQADNATLRHRILELENQEHRGKRVARLLKQSNFFSLTRKKNKRSSYSAP